MKRQLNKIKKLKKINVEKILMSTGRVPNTRFLGLEKSGMELRADGGTKVNNRMETNIPHIFAASNVEGKPMLETVAARDGYILLLQMPYLVTD